MAWARRSVPQQAFLFAARCSCCEARLAGPAHTVPALQAAQADTGTASALMPLLTTRARNLGCSRRPDSGLWGGLWCPPPNWMTWRKLQHFAATADCKPRKPELAGALCGIPSATFHWEISKPLVPSRVDCRAWRGEGGQVCV